MIPFYMKTAGFAEPDDPIHYLLASNGVFLVKNTSLFRTVTEAPGIAGLESQKPSLVLRIPKIPCEIVEKIWGFFDFAYRKWDGEAIALVYYAPDSGEFQLEIPTQRLFRYRGLHGWRTEGRVEYKFRSRPAGFLKLCDFHSHAGMAAFFSATDDEDDTEDGLRLVMGRMSRTAPEVRASFVAAGTRFSLRPEDVLEAYSRPIPPPPEWTRRLVCQYEGAVHRGGSGRA